MVINSNMISILKDKLDMCYFYLKLLKNYNDSFYSNVGNFQYFQGQMNICLIFFEMSELTFTGVPTQKNLDYIEDKLNKIRDSINDKYKDL